MAKTPVTIHVSNPAIQKQRPDYLERVAITSFVLVLHASELARLLINLQPTEQQYATSVFSTCSSPPDRPHTCTAADGPH